MDLVGTIMGWVTIPMAVMSITSVLAGLSLLVWGDWQIVIAGVLAFGMCLAFAPILERIVVSIDEATVRTLERGQRLRAQLFAIASGSFPMLAVLAWEVSCFDRLTPTRGEIPRALLWLWSYGVATGPWTAFALRVSRFRRTLCGIRAYAGHLAYWLLSLSVFGLGLGVSTAVPLMILPAVLPFAVGMLLALADRDALTNVRV